MSRVLGKRPHHRVLTPGERDPSAAPSLAGVGGFRMNGTSVGQSGILNSFPTKPGQSSHIHQSPKFTSVRKLEEQEDEFVTPKSHSKKSRYSSSESSRGSTVAMTSPDGEELEHPETEDPSMSPIHLSTAELSWDLPVSELAARVLRGCVVELEGCVGSGKSTLSSKIQELVHEDAEERFTTVFGEEVNQTFLAAFYNDTKRYGFAFQMFMLSSRLYQIDEASRQAKDENRLVFLDRGAVGDTLFALQNHKIGNLDSLDMDVYRSVCRQKLPETLSEKVDLVMYLDVDPRECHRRMLSLRQHKAEEGIPLDYVEGLDDGYFHLFMDWLSGRKGGFHDMNIGPAPPTVVLLWDQFGSPEVALRSLVELRLGRRRSPVVNFSVEAPELDESSVLRVKDVLQDGTSLVGQTLRLETPEEVEAIYESVILPLRQTVKPLEQQQGVQEQDILELTRLVISWDIPRNNSYRRVVMYYLSLAGRVDVFGKTTTVEAEKQMMKDD